MPRVIIHDPATSKVLGYALRDRIEAFTAQLDALEQLAKSAPTFGPGGIERQQEAQELVNRLVPQLQELGSHTPHELLDRCAHFCVVVTTVGPGSDQGVHLIRSRGSGHMAYINFQRHDWLACQELRDAAANLLKKRGSRQTLWSIVVFIVLLALVLLAVLFPELGQLMVTLICLAVVLALIAFPVYAIFRAPFP